MFHVKHFRRKQRSLPLPAAQHEESKRSGAKQGACNRGHNPRKSGHRKQSERQRGPNKCFT